MGKFIHDLRELLFLKDSDLGLLTGRDTSLIGKYKRGYLAESPHVRNALNPLFEMLSSADDISLENPWINDATFQDEAEKWRLSEIEQATAQAEVLRYKIAEMELTYSRCLRALAIYHKALNDPSTNPEIIQVIEIVYPRIVRIARANSPKHQIKLWLNRQALLGRAGT